MNVINLDGKINADLIPKYSKEEIELAIKEAKKFNFIKLDNGYLKIID